MPLRDFAGAPPLLPTLALPPPPPPLLSSAAGPPPRLGARDVDEDEGSEQGGSRTAALFAVGQLSFRPPM